MVKTKVNIANLYALLAGHVPTKTGFIAHPISLADGTKIAGLYKGFGSIVMVLRAPKPRKKGFRTLGPIQGDHNGNIYIED